MRRSSAAMPCSITRAGLPACSSSSAFSMTGSTVIASLSLPGCALAELVDAALQAVEVGKHQLGLDRLGVGHRIDAALDMGDVVILEAAQHMHDRVDLADVGEELVAQPFALRGAAHQAGDVDEGDAGRDDLLRLGDRRDLVQPRIGHRDFAGVRLDGAERIVRGLRGGRPRQRVEQCRFADVGKPNDPAFEAHGGEVLSRRPEFDQGYGRKDRRSSSLRSRLGRPANPRRGNACNRVRAPKQAAGSPTRSKPQRRCSSPCKRDRCRPDLASVPRSANSSTCIERVALSNFRAFLA